MATQAEIDELRRKAALAATDNTYGTDLVLGQTIDLKGVDTAAADIWEQKASGFSQLVNVSESGSSRAMGDLYKNALQMAAFYRGKDATPDVVAKPARTRLIVRDTGA